MSKQDTTSSKFFTFSKHCEADCWVLEMTENKDHFYLLNEAKWREVRDLLCECYGPPATSNAQAYNAGLANADKIFQRAWEKTLEGTQTHTERFVLRDIAEHWKAELYSNELVGIPAHAAHESQDKEEP